MTTTRVSKEVEFDAGHRVPDHASKCRSPHGHRYRVRATVEGPVVDHPGRSDHGMVVDFGDLKRWLTARVHDRYDHATIVAVDDVTFRDALGVYPNHAPGARGRTERGWDVVVVTWVPTAENMAAAVFGDLAPVVADAWPGCQLVSVQVWETPTSVAEVTR